MDLSAAMRQKGSSRTSIQKGGSPLNFGSFSQYLKENFRFFSRLARIHDSRVAGRTDIPGRVALGALFLQAFLRERSPSHMQDVYLRKKSVVKLLWGKKKRPDGSSLAISHDTICDYLPKVNLSDLRLLERDVALALARRGALTFPGTNLIAASVDGIARVVPDPESEGTLRIKQVLTKRDGTRIEIERGEYVLVHAQVVGTLIPTQLTLSVAKTSEYAAAVQVMKDTKRRYGHGFVGLWLFDALYPTAEVFNTAVSCGGDVLVKVKKGSLFDDALRLVDDVPYQFVEFTDCRGERKQYRAREVEGYFTERADIGIPLRFFEYVSDGGERQFCLTTLEFDRVSLGQLVKFAVAHWGIENNGHRDWRSFWNWDHLPSKTLAGITAWWHIIAVAATLFYAYLNRRLPPVIRRRFHTVIAAVKTLFLDFAAGMTTGGLPVWADT